MARDGDRSTLVEPLLPEPWTVRHVVRETSDVVTLEIQPGTSPRVAFAPGQFHMLYVFGVGEVPISIAGEGRAGGVLHTVRDVGAVTGALCRMGPGEVMGVRGPFGSAWPVAAQTGRDVLIVGGGIGIAPLRPVIDQVVQDRDNYDDVVVLCGAREPSDLLYSREHAGWRDAGVQVELTVDHGDHTWDGHVGVVTTLIRHARFDAGQAAAFLCGPEVMMQFTARELVARGVDPARTWLSMERNMKCAVGFCGHCQLGPEFVCMDGPVFAWPRMERLMSVREL